MAISEGFQAVEVWAETGDRIDPDDTSLTPPVTPSAGFGPTFSADAGDTPDRRVINELYWRETSALVDMRNHGVPPWDTEVDTLATGVKQVAGVLYRALVDNGPTYSNATDPTTAGQTVWARVSGTVGLPSAPSAPQATSPRSGELDWFWNCPLDGGAAVTAFDFQWRLAGATTWSAVMTVTFARVVLTGLANGQAVEARVFARNTQGTSGESGTGNATPRGTVPGGGATLALRAVSGDAEADLDWLEPDSGGVTISSYTAQWRTSGQAYSASRQQTFTSTSGTITGLANDTGYFFQVRATNSEGNGNFSNEASATPVAPIVIPPPPPDTVPDPPSSAPDGTPRRPLAVDWSWDLVTDNGGQIVDNYDFQWRTAGSAWSGNLQTVTGTCASHSVPNTSANIEARVRSRNSVGVSATWSPTGSVAAADLLGAVNRVHTFTSNQTFTWPYPDVTNATMLLQSNITAVVVSGLRLADVTVGGITYGDSTVTLRLHQIVELTGLTQGDAIVISDSSATRPVRIFPQPDVT